MATSIGQVLQNIDTRNPKEIFIAGLEYKISEQGDLRAGFDVTTDYPSRETYARDIEKEGRAKRRLVVRKIDNTVNNYALGHAIEGEFNPTTMESYEVLGWADRYLMEISAWSPDSKDRDNIVELIKLWMLELEQDIHHAYSQLPFLFQRELFAVRFLRAYDDVNMDIYRNGPIYIGSLVFEVVAPFYHLADDDGYEKYKINLIANIVECIKAEGTQT